MIRAKMPRTPKRLREDSIIEAVLEIRFDGTETIPEIAVGRLADRTEWKDFRRHRLPISEIPEQLRLTDPSLRVQPMIELIAADGVRTIKIGTNVLSFHNTKTYLGWNTSFKKELASTVSFLFKQVVGIKVRRVGLRYINALTEARHYISSATDLNIGITINNNPLNRPFNLNFTGDNGKLTTMTRIATKEFVQGVFPADMSAYVDIDTYTQDGFISQSAKEIKQVIDDAHTCLKSTFFDLLPEGIVTRLEATT
jgi:uncharacterized protein (TIGR04255 family)